MSARAHLTDCGLPGIKDIPYGLHMCHFYRGREDLAEALVAYFAAGLRNNERCIWITAAPLRVPEAEQALREAGLDVEAAARKGSLSIRDYSEWYGKAGVQKDDLIQTVLDEEQRALAAGYDGLRITGNASFTTPETWAFFMDYEATLNEAVRGRRITTLCSYRLGQCSAADILDVIPRHHCTLDRPDTGWQIITGLRHA